MSDLLDATDNSVIPSRPSLAQVKALVEFIKKHPDLAHRGLRNGVSRQKVKKLWEEVANIANSLEGTLKSTKGWIKFWSDKRRSIVLKKKQIEEGKINDTLSPIEQKILDLCSGALKKSGLPKKKRNVKVEPFNVDDNDSIEDMFPDNEDFDMNQVDNGRLMSAEAEERQLSIMEKLVEVMDQQAQAMTQMAQATHNNSKAMERLAEASHIQAQAVERLANTFENINSSVHDVRNAIMSIDYTMKRCYSASATQHRQNSQNLFS